MGAQEEQIAASSRWRAWRDAANTRDVDQAIRAIHQQIDQAVAARGPTCWVSGRCCNFNEYGHRLYVTGLEIAWVLTNIADAQRKANAQTAAGPCRFQVDKLCNIHNTRPLGCRVFFCQQGTQDWQQALYESFHESMKKLHARFDIDYQYLEWRQGLINFREAMTAQ